MIVRGCGEGTHEGKDCRFERKYGIRFQQFNDYLHERSVLLENDALSIEQRQTIMQEEDKLEREETKETEVEKQLT